jgi:hypothetical protein
LRASEEVKPKDTIISCATTYPILIKKYPEIAFLLGRSGARSKWKKN